MALPAIDINDQVRTQFDEASLLELAADIRAQGMLQPVLLCPLAEGRYLCIAGERRIRAARIAGLTAVPALVGEVTEEHAEDMQLAENIQREDLSLTDEANAIRRLYDRLGKVELVAARVKKSAAWVSKRLAVTYGEFDWRAKKLLEDGVTEDIELLQCVVKVAALNQSEASALDRAIRDGKAGRKEARAVLARLKKPDARKLPSRVKASAPDAGERNGNAASVSRTDARISLAGLVDMLRSEECGPIPELVSTVHVELQALMLDVCRTDYTRGAECSECELGEVLLRLSRLQAAVSLEDWTIPMFAMGVREVPLTLENVLTEVRRAVQPDEVSHAKAGEGERVSQDD
ncbi:ParB/RepB/Spo0J family partition protein [Trinickia terrae]|uniref:ParB/RepB/Spo0J family partition protein n=1 Tax=Trinickia terrae TaxID=2571161 RepID=UPI001F0E2759|nr:ParB/RepB/Spo0J family partition protein [Trinickia terrae]